MKGSLIIQTLPHALRLFMPDLTFSQVDAGTPGQFAHSARALPMKRLVEITKVYHLPGNQSGF